MKRMVATAAFLTFVGCNNLSTVSTTDNETATNQTSELLTCEEYSQSIEEPVNSSEEISVGSLARSTYDVNLPFTTVPKVGDTLTSGDSVRIILKGILPDSTLRVRVEKSVNGKIVGKLNDKTHTGLGWAEGISKFNGRMITIYSRGFTGTETRQWNGRTFVDSIRTTTLFDSTSAKSEIPGFHSLWAKVLSTPMGKRVGDTVQSQVETMDTVTHTQFGTGVIFDASKNRTLPYWFSIKYQNPLNPQDPYGAPEYNQLTVKHSVPMKSPNRLFDTLKVTINYNVDRTGDGIPDRHERDVIMTTEKGDTVSTLSGNAYTGKWNYNRHPKFK